MSQEKYNRDSERWLRQSEADIRAAKGSIKNKNYEWACFQCQQAAEKAIKSLYYYYVADPWGHSVVKLIKEFPKEDISTDLEKILDEARELDKLYIPTRYPNGLPELTPSEVYTKKEAQKAMISVKKIIKKVKELQI